ncbi:MAG: hypothetical protein IAF08_02915 [Rhizobacter sp.]|nr:hypothetical protein [Chlorobiales bacterium]
MKRLLLLGFLCCALGASVNLQAQPKEKFFPIPNAKTASDSLSCIDSVLSRSGGTPHHLYNHLEWGVYGRAMIERNRELEKRVEPPWRNPFNGLLSSPQQTKRDSIKKDTN